MSEKRLFLKIGNYSDINIKSKYSFASRNGKLKSEKKSSLNSTKLKFNQNILLNLLKKSNLKKHKKAITLSKFNSNSYNENILNTDFKISFNINKKFRDLPGLSKFRNLTYEKMNYLLKSEDKLTNEIKLNNLNNNDNHKSYDCLNKRENLSLLNKNIINKKIFNNRYNNIKLYNRNDLFKLNKELEPNKFLSNYNNTFSSLKNNYKMAKTSKSFSNIKNRKEKIMIDTTTNIQNILLKKNIKIKNKHSIQKWLNSIKNSIKIFKFLQRDSKVDRLIFFIEKPTECFEENLLDNKPGDKYQLLKSQIVKHKNKLENIIKEIKLNQIKSEYLMKKYIFELLSRKNKLY